MLLTIHVVGLSSHVSVTSYSKLCHLVLMWWTCIESTCIHDGLGFWVSNMHPEYGLSCLSYELCHLLWWTSVECIHVFMIVRWACLNLMMPAEDLACILVTYHLCRRFESCVCHVRIFRVVSPSAHVMGLQRISKLCIHDELGLRV